jgi:hypothetical protein
MITWHIPEDMTMATIFVSFLSSLQCLWFCGIYLRTSPWQSYLFHFLVHCSVHDFGDVQWWVHFPLAVRLIWGNRVVLWWIHNKCLMFDAVIMGYCSTIYTFLFLDNRGNAHELWWFFLSCLSTVFISEVVIMSTVDFIFPVAFYLLNDN